MYIRSHVMALMRNDSVKLHDCNGDLVPIDRIRREFGAIRKFIRENVPQGGRVGVRLPYDYLFVLCAYACMETGRVYIPLGSDWPKQRIDQIQASSQFNCCIDSENVHGVIADFEADLSDSENLLDPESTLYIIYTSGSTGEPKGVMIARRSYETFLRFLDGYFSSVNSLDSLLMIPEITFEVAMSSLAIVLLRQLELYISKSGGDAFRLALEVEDYGISWIDAVPSQIGILLSDAVSSRADLSTIRYLVLGGSRFPLPLLANIREKLPSIQDICNAYGPTEATVYTHFKRFNGNPETQGSV